ncbi:uncharacterized protein LOC129944716 [Eupeodes corollae]|uniref:uncharacterized protein LOC129944716 n=2 Tax=Eupeodes corollae TaxID=290404 RepID=UPI0024924E8E|nr:uncharacterized protein LOC129944716 [Eupeodes corollae]
MRNSIQFTSTRTSLSSYSSSSSSSSSSSLGTVGSNFISKAVNLLYTGFLLMLLLMENTHARIGYFWHITDLHLDTIYSTQGDVLRSCWRMDRQTSSSGRTPGRFGDYLCDSPWSLIESAALAMKSRQGDNVEFVLWTGDGLSHSAHPMFETKKLEILRNITDLLGRTFPSQFVFPVLGHEDGTNTNFRRMGELWRHWLPSEALHTFEKGGYYSIEQTKSRLRIIALNTNFMRHDPKYSQSHLAAVRQRQPNGGSNGGSNNGGSMDSTEYKNFYYHHGGVHQHHYHSDGSSGYGTSHHHMSRGSQGGSNSGIGAVGGMVVDGGGRVSALSEYENQDTEKQWIWLEDVLTKSKNNKETVYIVGHIPPGSDERHVGSQQNGHTTFTESNNMRYLELIRKYSSIIQGQFFGHLHSDSFRIIYDDKGKPVSWMMISPSVTPRKMSVGSNNPAMRLYKFDTDSGQVLDYTQYFLDLSLANTLGEPNWQPEYNLTHYYGLNDISAISLHNFVDRFTSNDGSWFPKYYRANTVRYQTDPCEGICMLNHYCAITRVDYKEFRQCLEKEQSALRSHSPAMQSCSFLILLLSLALSCNAAMQILPKHIHHWMHTTSVAIVLALRTILFRILPGLQRPGQYRHYSLKMAPNTTTSLSLSSSSSPLLSSLSSSSSSKQDTLLQFQIQMNGEGDSGHHMFKLIGGYSCVSTKTINTGGFCSAQLSRELKSTLNYNNKKNNNDDDSDNNNNNNDNDHNRILTKPPPSTAVIRWLQCGITCVWYIWSSLMLLLLARASILAGAIRMHKQCVFNCQKLYLTLVELVRCNCIEIYLGIVKCCQRISVCLRLMKLNLNLACESAQKKVTAIVLSLV